MLKAKLTYNTQCTPEQLTEGNDVLYDDMYGYMLIDDDWGLCFQPPSTANDDTRIPIADMSGNNIFKVESLKGDDVEQTLDSLDNMLVAIGETIDGFRGSDGDPDDDEVAMASKLLSQLRAQLTSNKETDHEVSN